MYLFLSDFHFGLGTPEAQARRRQDFFACLDHYADRLEALCINGDLFDFWFEWKRVILKDHFSILCKLKGIADRGAAIHYLAGNHDFALSRFLQDEIGAQIHRDEHVFETGGRRFYLQHGDGLAPADWGYRLLKRLFRSRFNQKLYSLLHPDFALEFAHLCSRTSRNHSSRRWDVDGWAYREAARAKIHQGFDYVIYSHTHEPLLEPLGRGVYVNTGDWLKHNSYAVWEDGVMTLKYWGMPWMERSQEEGYSKRQVGTG
ncbi:MAG: UDP-2,3-diacylglucosamine diphosphatase [Candidatus Zixiibacteriota bacterium]|nr:MAG: UDP-2,3-diacylglucosamine diphosphatase [candidate division Zixibacteria bacterium]